MRSCVRAQRTLATHTSVLSSVTSSDSHRHMLAATSELLRRPAQSEATRSFTVEMEEAAALPLDDEESSAVPHTPLREVDTKAGGAAACATAVAGASLAAEFSSSIDSSLASAGVSNTNENHFSQPHTQPRLSGAGGRAANLPMLLSSLHTTTAGGATSTGGANSLRLLTCQADTPSDQREAEAAASRDPAFHPMILCPLQNLGNTCYFNSGVQMLANCPALIYALRNAPLFHTAHASASQAAVKLCMRGGAATHALLEEFATLLSRMEKDKLGSGEALSPVRALDALARVYTQFEGRSQQDAAEMMTALLASFEEEGGQYAEAGQLLASFAEDAVLMTQNSTNRNGDGGATPSQPIPDDPVISTRRSEPYFADGFSRASQSTPTKTASPLPGTRSAHDIAVLRFMKQVNRENEQLERRVKQRQRKPYLGTFRPPRLHFNPVVDGFRGYAVSQVECHYCHGVSRVVSDYNALLIDVPTKRQRSQFAARHPNLRRLAPDGQPLQAKSAAGITWWNPLSIFYFAWDRLSRLFMGSVPFPLTLQECLDIHFDSVTLQGANKYHCDSCGTVSEATKSETLLGLPEYLVLHMKRFEAGRCFHSKKTDSVIFPASWTSLTPKEAAQSQLSGTVPEILDLRRYLHPVAAPFAEPIPHCLKGSLGAALDEQPHSPHDQDVDAFPGATSMSNHHVRAPPRNSNSSGGSSITTPSPSTFVSRTDGCKSSTSTANPWAIPTTYTLDGIVNHHGGYDGGHYTVYLYKTTAEQRTWLYISDDEIERASASDAADSEEYVLLYRRQPIVQQPVESDEGEQLRQKACYYLSREVNGETSPVAAAAPLPVATATHAAVGGDASPPAAARTVTSSSSPPSTTSTSTSPSSPTSPYVYISRMWLQRVAFLHEPGPIVNRLCYCTPDDQKKVALHRSLFPADVQVPADVPHVHGPPVDWFYVPITPTDYAIFYDAFGGNAAVTAEEVAAIRQMQEEFLAAVMEAERAKPRGVAPQRVVV